jgi:two-component system, response regulator PdtaR
MPGALPGNGHYRHQHPELGGVEAANAVWREQSIPIIFVSARHDPEALGLEAEGHVVAYLVKPIKRTDLEAAIRKVIEL